MSQITGKVEIRVNGKKLATENRATLNPGGVTRAAERHGGKTYYGEEETPPLLETNVLITKETDVINLGSITDATVMFIADTGQKYFMRDAFTTEPVPHDGSGKAPLKMSGTVERM